MLTRLLGCSVVLVASRCSTAEIRRDMRFSSSSTLLSCSVWKPLAALRAVVLPLARALVPAWLERRGEALRKRALLPVRPSGEEKRSCEFMSVRPGGTCACVRAGC